MKTEYTRERKEWKAIRKALCKELALAMSLKSEEAFVAEEAIKARDAELKECNEKFRAFRATTDVQLAGEFHALCATGCRVESGGEPNICGGKP